MSGVQVSVLALTKTPLCAGFSSFYSSLEFCPTGVNQQFIRAYWGKFGVNAGVIFDTEVLGSYLDPNTSVLMMAKASANTPQIKNSNGRLQIVLNQSGKRSYLSLGVPDSKQNRVYAQMIATQIWNDILAGHFTGIDKYKRVSQTESEQTASVIEDLSLDRLWEKYSEFKRPQLSPSTIAKDFDRIASHILKFPSCKPSEAISIRDYLVKIQQSLPLKKC